MTAALLAALAVMGALVALATWVISIVRADGRERAAALVLAEAKQGEVNLANERATREVTRLAADVRRLTRRGDALEEFIRDDLVRRTGAVDDGTDLLLAELGILAEGPSDDDDDGSTVAAGGGALASRPVPIDAAADRPDAGGTRIAGAHEEVPKGEAP